MGWRPHGDAHAPGPRLGQVGSDLGAGVADARDQHVPAPVRGGVAVGRRVHQRTGEGPRAWPVGHDRDAVEAGRQHDVPGRHVDPSTGDPVAAGGGKHGVNLDAEAHLDAVVGGVSLQVAHEVVAGDPAAVGARQPQPRQMRLDARRVQVQAVVPLGPGLADVLAAVQHQGADAVAQQARCRGQAGRAGPDDDDGHHVQPPTSTSRARSSS